MNNILFALGDTQRESVKEFIATLKQEVLVVLKDYDFTLCIEDSVVSSYNPLEVATRLKQPLWWYQGWDSNQIIKAGDLSKYELSLAGRWIELTFKEYEPFVS